jgi:hypothetical protein
MERESTRVQSGAAGASLHPAADRRDPDANGVMGAPRDEQRARHLVGKVTLVVVFAAMCYLALVPNARGEFLGFLPQKLRRWICEHDDLNNVVGFAVFGLIAFRIGGRGQRERGAGVGAMLRRIFAHRGARLAALMVLVCVFELLQLIIPGRMSGLQDVCTGWSGLFAAWLLAVVLGWRSE